MSTYQGWTNYETWAVNLWLTNDEGLYHAVQDLAEQAKTDAGESKDEIWATEAEVLLADALEEFIGEMTPDLGASLWSDLLTAAIGEIDWREIAGAWLTE